jgi:glycosyltransferase involved in cell wall biosynthesis
MRILYLGMIPELGGAERGLLSLLQGIRQDRPDWQLELVLPDHGPFWTAAERIGVTLHRLPMPEALERIGGSALSAGGYAGRIKNGLRLLLGAPGAARYVRRLGELIRSRRPDIVHSNGIKLHLLSSLVLPSSSRLVWHIQDFVGSRTAVRNLLRLARSPVSLSLAVSRHVAEDVQSSVGGARVTTLHNAIDVDGFRQARREPEKLDAIAGFGPAPEGVVRVGFVATYARWKGHQTFLEAIALLPPDVADRVRAYVVGGPIYRTVGSQLSREELEAHIDRLGIHERVRLLPFQRDVRLVMAAFDVFVHASTAPEPFGNVVVEAMAARCAVIVAATGGVEEAYTAEVDAIGAKPRDPQSIADAITRLVRDPELRQRLADRGSHSAERFAQPVATRKIVDLYEELVRDGR